MKNIINLKPFGVLIVCCSILFVSCEEYLDRPSAATVTERDIYVNFISFQGFIEELHNCIVSPSECGAWNNYSFADENMGPRPYNFETGNWWGAESYFYLNAGVNVNTTSMEGRDRRIWEYAWYAIAKANIALEKIDEPDLFSGTDYQHNLIKGQALFFRGWFYFEICRFWGGMPYITWSLDPVEDFGDEKYQRLTFKETALKMAEDFRAAADLLPNHWEDVNAQIPLHPAGKDNNRQRVNKFHALSYLGKALLFAASPMINEEATGNNTFDATLCTRAADAFGELLALNASTQKYRLATWNEFMNVFYRFGLTRNGLDEAIMMPTLYERSRFRWSTIGALCPSDMGLNSSTTADVPTHNIVKNFATANGFPIQDDPTYDPNNPWKNLEPRFYAFIAKDGDKINNYTGVQQYLQSANGAWHRSSINPATMTGYYQKKFNGMRPEFTLSEADNIIAAVPYMRLADVYLMYAEAVNFQNGGGPKATSSTFPSLTAEGAINVVRNRAQLPDIADVYTANQNVFFEEIIRERAVELFMEGARFCDLRRWNRFSDPRYLDKTCIDFDRGADGDPINIRERIVLTRPAGKKYNWLPLQVKFTTMEKTFPQNPGW